jgi:hypothetical protein
LGRGKSFTRVDEWRWDIIVVRRVAVRVSFGVFVVVVYEGWRRSGCGGDWERSGRSCRGEGPGV